MSVRLNSPIWNKAKRAAAYSKVLADIGKEAVSDVGINFKTAKRTGVTAKIQKVRLSGKNKGARVTKTIVRSAPGETPAIATGQLSRGTKWRRKSAFSVVIVNDVNHAKFLEPPARLNRPFLKKPIDANKKKYLEMARKGTKVLT